MNKLFAHVLEWLFPSHANCLGCQDPRIGIDGPPLCDACLASLAKTRMPQNVCHHCGHILLTYDCKFCKKKGSKGIVWMRAAHRYNGPIRTLIHRFKYSMVNLAGDVLIHELVDACLADPPPKIDICTFVPMDQRSLKQRGTNHAQYLCEGLCKRLDLPMAALLAAEKTRKRQAQLSREQRLKSKKGKYTVIANVKGKHILLIDDVLTTGATARECAAVLRRRGAESVSVLCVAFA